MGIPEFKDIGKTIKVPFTKTYKFFKGCNDYGGFVKSLLANTNIRIIKMFIFVIQIIYLI